MWRSCARACMCLTKFVLITVRAHSELLQQLTAARLQAEAVHRRDVFGLTRGESRSEEAASVCHEQQEQAARALLGDLLCSLHVEGVVSLASNAEAEDWASKSDMRKRKLGERLYPPPLSLGTSASAPPSRSSLSSTSAVLLLTVHGVLQQRVVQVAVKGEAHATTATQ